MKVILAARNTELGTSAVDELQKDGCTDLEFHQLDISSSESIAAFAGWFKEA
jgi:short-subunit dehydrogenase